MAVEYKTLEQMLEEQGLTMEALTDPGARFGYGSAGEYGQFFSPFDISGFREGMESLKGLESSLLGGQEQKFGYQGMSARSKQQGALSKIRGGKQQGFKSGAQERQMEYTRREGAEGYGDIVAKNVASIRGIEEQIGGQYGQFAGLFHSFLGDTAVRGLQVRQGDPTGGEEPGRTISQADIDRMVGGLNPEDRDSFIGISQGMIGNSYQSLIDLAGSYYSDSYGGGTYG